jgi:hypothetical protein
MLGFLRNWVVLRRRRKRESFENEREKYNGGESMAGRQKKHQRIMKYLR